MPTLAHARKALAAPRAQRALAIALFSAAATGAIALRVARTHRVTFAFLVWNLALAWAPWLLSLLATRLHRGAARAPALYATLALWLLFFPNAPYLLTDFVHLRGHQNPLWWFDLLLLSSATAAGWLCALDGLDRVHAVLAARHGAPRARVAVALVCWLAGLGVYLGRFLRFNSWELLSNPAPLAAALLDRLAHPLAHPRTHAFALGFGALLALSYALLRGAARAPSRPLEAARAGA